MRRGETEVPGENISVQRKEPTNSTHILTPDLGIEPGPFWWEGSALTAAPSLHPRGDDTVITTIAMICKGENDDDNDEGR